jgi:hypothetical protein
MYILVYVDDIILVSSSSLAASSWSPHTWSWFRFCYQGSWETSLFSWLGGHSYWYRRNILLTFFVVMACWSVSLLLHPWPPQMLVSSFLLIIQPSIAVLLEACSILPSLDQIYPMVLIDFSNTYMLHVTLIGLPLNAFYVTCNILLLLVYTFGMCPLVSSRPTLMLIGLVVLMIVDPREGGGMLCSLVLTWLVGVSGSKLLFHRVVLRLSTRQKLFGYSHYYMSWVVLRTDL